MEEECRVECVQEVKHRVEDVGKGPGRVVLPSRRAALPPFLEKIFERKT